MDAEDKLPVSVSDVLLAFDCAYFHTTNTGSPKDYLKRRKEVALDILDWAVEESDRGQELRRLKAEALYKRGDGSIRIGPIE